MPVPEIIILEQRWSSSRNRIENHWKLIRRGDIVLYEMEELFDASGEDDEWNNIEASFPFTGLQTQIQDLRSSPRAEFTSDNKTITFEVKDGHLTIGIYGDVACNHRRPNACTLLELFSAFEM